jgi:hypothetical protein
MNTSLTVHDTVTARASYKEAAGTHEKIMWVRLQFFDKDYNQTEVVVFFDDEAKARAYSAQFLEEVA